MTKGIFITGTDTGVGKTLAACALLRAFAQRGEWVVGMKPVAAGTQPIDGESINPDVSALRAASNVAAPLASMNPYSFAPPVAPHIAAQQAGVTIELGNIVRAYRDLAARADRIVVEGAGGALVPLNRHDDMLDIARSLALPVVLVVGLRLGCLNHALLSALAIRMRGLRLAGWIASAIDPALAQSEENVASLVERLAAPCLAVAPFLPAPVDATGFTLRSDALAIL